MKILHEFERDKSSRTMNSTQKILHQMDAYCYPLSSYAWKYKNFVCEVRRSPARTWNGYVNYEKFGRLNPGQGFMVFDQSDLHVHGGVTWFTPGCVGFDTCHHGDWSPSVTFVKNSIYRSFDYVVEQCVKLAKQLHTILFVVPKCFNKWKAFPALCTKHGQEIKENKSIYDCCVHEYKMRIRDSRAQLSKDS